MTEPLPEEVVERLAAEHLSKFGFTPYEDKWRTVLEYAVDDPEFTRWMLAKCVADGVLRKVSFTPTAWTEFDLEFDDFQFVDDPDLDNLYSLHRPVIEGQAE